MIDEEKKDIPDEGEPEKEITPEEPTPDDDGIEDPSVVWQTCWLWNNGSAEEFAVEPR